MNIVSNLDFGQDSAESEIRTLHQVFLTLPFYERIRDEKKWLVIGRKGTGKTAACIMFSRQIQSGERIINLSAKKLSISKATNLEKAGINSEDIAQKKWEYVFLLQVCKCIVGIAEEKYGKNYLHWPDLHKEVRDFLAERDNANANFIDKAKKFLRRISKFAIKVFEAEGSIEVDKSGADATELSEELEKLFCIINELSDTIFEKNLFILVDQVDDLWDSSKDQQTYIVGLLRASKEINDLMNHIKVIVFLRSDIFDFLDYNNKDHYRTLAEVIEWDENNLKKLITLRITQSTGLTGDDNFLWDSIFPQKVDGEKTIKYLMNNTLMRPRDLIQLCNRCRDLASNHKHEKILADDIKSALAQYSRWKTEDLISEYKFQYPFLGQLLATLFHGYNKTSISRKEFEELFLPYQNEFIKKYGEEYLSPIDDLLQTLYSIGFLGVIYNGKRMHEALGDKFIVPHASLLEIHPAFRKGLNISEGVGRIEQNIVGSHNSIQTIHQTSDINISGSVVIRNSASEREKKEKID